LNRLSWLKLKPNQLLTPSVLLLVAANLVPLYGVFSLHWQVFPILLLFWMENVVVGIFNALKMLVASPASPASWLTKIIMIPFFCFHYGMFTLIHGVFVFGFFGGYFTSGASFPNENSLFQAISNFQLGWAFLALFLSHAISFTINYIGKGEYKKAELKELMNQPYSRVVLLHVTILIGGFMVMSLGSPVFALLVLILLKTFIDIQAHLREHKKYSYNKVESTGTKLQTSNDAFNN
jgi:hypothetical protein